MFTSFFVRVSDGALFTFSPPSTLLSTFMLRLAETAKVLSPSALSLPRLQRGDVLVPPTIFLRLNKLI